MIATPRPLDPRRPSPTWHLFAFDEATCEALEAYLAQVGGLANAQAALELLARLRDAA